jgi:hypothetical protein
MIRENCLTTTIDAAIRTFASSLKQSEQRGIEKLSGYVSIPVERGVSSDVSFVSLGSGSSFAGAVCSSLSTKTT